MKNTKRKRGRSTHWTKFDIDGTKGHGEYSGLQTAWDYYRWKFTTDVINPLCIEHRKFLELARQETIKQMVELNNVIKVNNKNCL